MAQFPDVITHGRALTRNAQLLAEVADLGVALAIAAEQQHCWRHRVGPAATVAMQIIVKLDLKRPCVRFPVQG
jgi:hypothetical protein